jgi:hypothetical protein
MQPVPLCYADTDHRFSEKEDDWGFMQFCNLQELKGQKDEFYPDGVLHIRTTMKVELEEKYTGVTRQRTGYVGLKNQVCAWAAFHVPQYTHALNVCRPPLELFVFFYIWYRAGMWQT